MITTLHLLVLSLCFRYVCGIDHLGSADDSNEKPTSSHQSSTRQGNKARNHHRSKKFGTLNYVKFVAVGDTPHGARERKRFGDSLERVESRNDFLVHLGDIHERQQNCDASRFDEALYSLRRYSKIPSFVIPGEADWYTCLEQDSAWSHWSRHFLNFQNYWNHRFDVRHQEGRPENFAFNYNGVLFVAFHVISASVRDWKVWKRLVKDNVTWLQNEVVINGFSDDVTAIVLMAHAKPHTRRYRAFYESLIQVTSHIKKPLLYLHTDEQEFQYERNYLVENMLRVSVGSGGDEDPLEIIVDPSEEFPFVFKRKAIP